MPSISKLNQEIVLFWENECPSFFFSLIIPSFNGAFSFLSYTETK